MSISAEQRAWLKDLGNMVGEAPAEAETAAPPKGGEKGDQDRPQLAIDTIERGPDDKALLGLPLNPFDIIPDVVNTKITISNESGVALRVVSGSVDKKKLATFNPAPPVDIPAKTTRVFGISNKGLGPFPAPVGTGGEVKYDVVGDTKKTQFFMKWERGFALPSRETTQTVTPDDGSFTIQGINTGGDDFNFIISGKGGSGPDPGPDPKPGPNVGSSCLITVVNQTTQTLTRAEAEHERGDFMMLPPSSVPPGGTVNFVSVETPNAKEQGCKGFIVWEVGSPMVATWRIEWDNPEQAKNNSLGTLTPQTAGFRSQDVIGQGEENVPTSFTLSGGAPGPGPVPPGPVPPAEPDPAFEPPVEAKQPTLHKGDKSSDGWVEYAQMLLNFHLKTKLPEDGDFGSGTHAAVLKFQKDKSLQVDGTIGNQTWAALREGAPEKPSTDGRQPHTFVEGGVEARWVLESQTNNRYDTDVDLLKLAVQTVGDTPIDTATEATVRITPPGGKVRVVKVKLGPPRPKTGGIGFSHEVDLPAFRKNFPSVPVEAPVSEYLVEAFLPKELGGDLYKGKVRDK